MLLMNAEQMDVVPEVWHNHVILKLVLTPLPLASSDTLNMKSKHSNLLTFAFAHLLFPLWNGKFFP